MNKTAMKQDIQEREEALRAEIESTRQAADDFCNDLLEFCRLQEKLRWERVMRIEDAIEKIMNDCTELVRCWCELGDMEQAHKRDRRFWNETKEAFEVFTKFCNMCEILDEDEDEECPEE